MNIVLVLVSTVLISTDTYAVDSSFLIRSDLALKASRNSLLNTEIIIKGSQAEKVYVVERSDQDQAQEALQQKIRKINRAEKKTTKQEAQLSALHEELNILAGESRVNRFSSQENDICPRASKSSYFSKNKWTCEPGTKAECLSEKISATKDGKLFTYDRPLVACNIKSENGDIKVYLEASTRYEKGKNLRFFVMTKEDGTLKPIAYLMNKSEPKKPKPGQPATTTELQIP